MTYRTTWLLLFTLGITGFALDCSLSHPDANAAANKQPAKAQSATASEAVNLDPRMNSGIKIEELKEENLPLVLKVSGKIQFDEDHVARIIPPLMGQVQDLRLKVGDSVRKGDTLFSIYSREAATALSEHMDSHKDLDLAEKTFAMTQDLYEHQASSRIALDQARNDLDKAKLRVNRTEESLRVLGIANDSASSTIAKIPVRSPLNGTVIERKVTEGQFVQPDVNPLLTIASLDDVWVLGDVFERDLHLIRIGQRASVVTDAYPDEMFNASVSWISDVVDDTTRTVKVRFLVANAGRRLKPEMFASANIFLQESQKGLTVPAEAVLSEGGHNYVYVCVGEGSFVRRPVEVTQDDGTKSRVINGLKTGDKVVVKGAILINSEREKKET